MMCKSTRCLLLLLVVLCMVLSSSGILLGKMRQKEEPGSNVVPSSRFLYPETEDFETDCKTDLGHAGRCVDIRKCHAARRAVYARSHPVRCGWVNHIIPRVCCHPDQVLFSKMEFRPARNRRRNGVIRFPY